jgi:uncharacterized protein YrrD
MRLRLSTAIGLPVVDESEQILGTIADICIHPDTLCIEGFFVHIQGFFSSEMMFLPCTGVEHWGSRIRVRHAHVLSPVEDVVRISRIAEEDRPVFRQMIISDTGKRLGCCSDIQFDTRSFRLEWLFPRRWLRWGIPIPIRAIVEIKREAIVIQTKERLPLQDQVSEDISVIEAVISTPAV